MPAVDKHRLVVRFVDDVERQLNLPVFGAENSGKRHYSNAVPAFELLHLGSRVFVFAAQVQDCFNAELFERWQAAGFGCAPR